MHFQSKSLILFFIISVCFIYLTHGATTKKVSSAKPKCDEAKVDQCAAELAILTDEKFQFPADIAQTTKLCKKLKNVEKCVKDYTSNCLDSSTRQTLSVMIYSIGRTNKNLCSSTKRKAMVVKLGQCLQPEFSTLHKHSQDFVAVAHAIRGYKPANQRVPMLCCEYYRFKERILGTVRNNCEEYVGEMETIVNGYAQDALNLICGDYTDDSDKCDPIFDKIPKNNKKPEWKTFLFPLGDILAKE